MLAILSALRQEHSRILPLLDGMRQVASAPFWLAEGQYGGQSLLLARCGMGRAAVEAAFQFIQARYSVQAVLFLGFAGALTADLTGGELVLCDTFILPRSENSQADKPETPKAAASAALHRLACQRLQAAGLPFRTGASVTLVKPVNTPEERLALSATYGALTAEMEDYWLASLAAAAGVPFLSARAISDELNDRLPEFERFSGEGGRLQMGRLLGHLLLHPSELIALAPLAGKMRLAQASLLDAFKALATVVPAGEF